jgi:hypothetical protein
MSGGRSLPSRWHWSSLQEDRLAVPREKHGARKLLVPGRGVEIGIQRHVQRSITKQFTALAVMQLQEQNKLHVDDPICRYLVDCPAELGRGVVAPGQHLVPFGQAGKVGNARHVVEQLATNSGYHLLGLIIERTSGMPWGAYVKQHILIPAGTVWLMIGALIKVVPSE